MSETPETGTTAPTSAAARLFDLRSLIGGLFVLYGIMLIVAGSFTSKANLAKATNININLWMGIGMLVLGILFLLWWRLNPVRPAEANQEDLSQPSQPSGPSGTETGS
jgi:type VI protein secretion system component VasK